MVGVTEIVGVIVGVVVIVGVSDGCGDGVTVTVGVGVGVVVGKINSVMLGTNPHTNGSSKVHTVVAVKSFHKSVTVTL